MLSNGAEKMRGSLKEREKTPRCKRNSYSSLLGAKFYLKQNKIQSTLGFATMGKAANLALATRNAVTDLF